MKKRRAFIFAAVLVAISGIAFGTQSIVAADATLPLRIHYEGKWQEGIDTVQVVVGGRLAIHAKYTLAGAVPSGDTIRFQWYSNNVKSTTGGTEISKAMGNIYIPEANVPGEYYYYAKMTYTPSGGQPQETLSDVAKVTVTAKAATENPLSTSLTPAEASGWLRTTSSAEVYAYCELLAANSNGRIRMIDAFQTAGRVVGKTEPITVPMLIMGKPAPESPEAVPADKAIVLINCNIHSGEVEGKESMLIFARELALGLHDDLLEDLVILLFPNLNADGNDNLGKNRNNTQYTPEIVGTRFTGAAVNPTILPENLLPNSESHNYYNINRDMTKLDSPEATGVVAIMNEWDPVIFIDAHATNGSLMRHAITYNWGLHPNTDPAILAYNRDAFSELALGAKSYLYNVQGKVSIPYGNFSGNINTTGSWRTFEDYPRYTTNYAGLRNRLAILLEVYSHDPYTVRVDTQYACIYGTLLAVQQEKTTIKKLIADADEHAINRAVNGIDPEKDYVALNSSMEVLDLGDGKEGKIVINSFESSSSGSVINYVLRDTDTDANAAGDRVGTLFAAEKDYVIPYYGLFVPTGIETMGAYYLIDADCAEGVELLNQHGIEFTQLTEPAAVDAGSFQWYKATRRNPGNMYEGHYMNRFEGSWITTLQAQIIPAGTYVVSTAQSKGSLASLLLEPASVDGAVSWNFFDNKLDADAAGTIRANYANETSDRGIVAIPIFKVNAFDAMASQTGDFRLMTDAHLVEAGQYFNVSPQFTKNVSSNAAVLTVKYDADKFLYRGFTPADGVTVLNTETDKGLISFTFMVDGYNAKGFGNVLFSAKEDIDIKNEENEIVGLISYVYKAEDNTKTVITKGASTTFTTFTGFPPGVDEYNLIVLSNLIDAFGAGRRHPDWDSLKFYDVNNNGTIDIVDITAVAKKIKI